ncbi:hypothetical protein EE612_049994 [Oryza sativa]|nr:hypothetical protein EE612_049994 [Oryza sativa]
MGDKIDLPENIL